MYKEHMHPCTHINHSTFYTCFSYHRAEVLGWKSLQLWPIPPSDLVPRDLQIARNGFIRSTRRFPSRYSVNSSRTPHSQCCSSNPAPAGWAGAEHALPWNICKVELSRLGRWKGSGGGGQTCAVTSREPGAPPHKRLRPSPPSAQTWLVQSDTYSV